MQSDGDPFRLVVNRWFLMRSPMVQARILKLNRNRDVHHGDRLRGWHPAPTLKAMKFEQYVVGKGEFIHAYGRAAWDVIPRRMIRKSGKRAYVALEWVLDVHQTGAVDHAVKR